MIKKIIPALYLRQRRSPFQSRSWFHIKCSYLTLQGGILRAPQRSRCSRWSNRKLAICSSAGGIICWTNNILWSGRNTIFPCWFQNKKLPKGCLWGIRLDMSTTKRLISMLQRRGLLLPTLGSCIDLSSSDCCFGLWFLSRIEDL